MLSRIILADDSLTTQKIVQISLSEGPFELENCFASNQLYSMLERSLPDLLILSFHFSKELAGYDLCLKLKEKYSKLPILILFNSSDKIDERAFYQSKADAKMVKPVDSELLIETCENLLKKEPKRRESIKDIEEKVEDWVVESQHTQMFSKDESEDSLEMPEPIISSPKKEDESSFSDWDMAVPDILEKDEDVSFEEHIPSSLLEIEEESEDDRTVLFETPAEALLKEEKSEEYLKPDRDFEELIKAQIKPMVEKLFAEYWQENAEKMSWKILPQITEKLIQKELEKISKSVLDTDSE
ncbi:MAG: response regulator [Bacteriovoracaceae bacterium]|nr:response regulator [Bacteriovoracaceae bacterium]